MSCPRCGIPLTNRSVHDVETRFCERCHGMFLHRGELNRIAEPTDGDLEFSTLDEESFAHEDRYPASACPECSAASMRKVEFNIYTGIILDYCESCGGFWLDGKELARVDDEVRKLNELATDGKQPAMLWFAQFIWSLPR